MGQTLAQMYVTCGSIEAILQGINCVLFAFCVRVLWFPRILSHRIFLLSSTVQFALCVAQLGMHIQQLVTAINVYPGEGPSTYFLAIGQNKLFLPTYSIFLVNFAIEGLVLIWRLFIIYGKSLKVCLIPLILWVSQTSVGGTAAGIVKRDSVTGVNTFPFRVLTLTTWIIIAAVNFYATLLITAQLWTAQRRLSETTAHRLSAPSYKSSILIVVECGALVTACALIMFILYSSGHPVGLVGIGVSTQVATLVPLLIVARFGIISQEKARASIVSPFAPIEINVVRTEHRHVDEDLSPSETPRSRPRLVWVGTESISSSDV